MVLFDNGPSKSMSGPSSQTLKITLIRIVLILAPQNSVFVYFYKIGQKCPYFCHPRKFFAFMPVFLEESNLKQVNNFEKIRLYIQNAYRYAELDADS